MIQLTGTYNLMLNCFLFALFFNIGDADDRGIHQNFDSTPASPSFKKGSMGAKRVTPDWPATRIASTATQPLHPSRPPKEPSNTAVNMNSCLFVYWNAQNGKLWSGSVRFTSLCFVLPKEPVWLNRLRVSALLFYNISIEINLNFLDGVFLCVFLFAILFCFILLGETRREATVYSPIAVLDSLFYILSLGGLKEFQMSSLHPLSTLH